jgi:flagellar M-ring protein FliF
VQNINHLRAREGELARTIRSIDRVAAARVHLVLPERPLFSREKLEPSASIVLKLRGSLEAQQVRAIRHLAASAVNGLKPNRVSIVDETGRLLADGADEDIGGLGAGADERKVAFEKRMRDQVENIVTSVVGPGRARVQLTADFDFNRVTQTSDRYDPEGRVVRSSQTREETLASSEAREGQVTVGNELPGAAQQQRGGAANNNNAEGGNKSDNRKSEEVVNYEISRTSRTEVIEGGRVNRISVAVLVDGVYTKNDKGESSYAPRDKEELDRIATLVRSAIGFDQKRGDQVEVVNLRFAEMPQNLLPESKGLFELPQFTKDDIMRGIELAVMGFLGLIVLFFVVRPLVRRIVTPEHPAGARLADGTTVGANGLLLPDGVNVSGGGAGGIRAAGGPNVELVGSDQNVAISNRTSAMIDIAKVQGQVHAQSVQKVGELAERNPHETVAIIRQWLTEPA